MTSEEYVIFARGKVVLICEAMLGEEIGIIAGSRRLKSLGHELLDDHDEDFLTFIAIDSQTDHLPVDQERQNWSKEALVVKDKEIAEAEAFHRDAAVAACKRLIERFDIHRDR